MMASLFWNPMTLESGSTIWLLIPLCISVAVVYKAIRVERPAQLPLQILLLVVYMLGGLTLLGVALWAIQEIVL